MSRRTAAVVALLASLLLVPWGWAHPDVVLFDGGRLRLEPGEAAVRPMALHFHRLAVRWTAGDEGPEGAWLFVVPAEAEHAGAVAAEDAWFAARLSGGGRLQHLVDCCLGEDERHLLMVVRNDGPAPVELDLRAWAIHDDFAVVGRRAEAGALEVPLALFAVLGIAALVVAARDRRRDVPAARHQAARHPAVAALACRASGALLVGSAATALLLGAAGALRYGGGLVPGMIVVLADLPVPGGLFGSRAAFVLAWLLLGWVAAIAAWIVAVAAGAHRRARGVVAMGGALATVSLGGAVAMSAAYGGSLVPLALGLVLAAPLAAAAWQIRGSTIGAVRAG